MTWEDKKLERPRKCYERSDKAKFLTEAMGICFWGDHSCDKCTDDSGNLLGGKSRLPVAINFSTPESFFRLYNWAKEQDWWLIFVFSSVLGSPLTSEPIDPDQFSNEVYTYLKSRQGEPLN